MEEETKIYALSELLSSELPMRAKKTVLYELLNALNLKFDHQTLKEIEHTFKGEATQELKQAQLQICPHCLFDIPKNAPLFETGEPFDTSLLKKNYLKHLKTCPWLELLSLYGDLE